MADAIIRITGGNFRLLNRLLTQIDRILEINALQQVTKTVVEAARRKPGHRAGLKLLLGEPATFNSRLRRNS